MKLFEVQINFELLILNYFLISFKLFNKNLLIEIQSIKQKDRINMEHYSHVLSRTCNTPFLTRTRHL